MYPRGWAKLLGCIATPHAPFPMLGTDPDPPSEAAFSALTHEERHDP